MAEECCHFPSEALEKSSIDDPFSIRSSDEVVYYLKDSPGMNWFSVDVQGLFCSVPQDNVLLSLKQNSDVYGYVRFENEVGLSSTNVLYLHSLYICHQGSVFSQQDGVPIGSCIAPVLCNLYLARSDRELQDSLKVFQGYKCFRYVDDFLVCIPSSSNVHDVCIGILGIFKAAHCGLQFTNFLSMTACNF